MRNGLFTWVLGLALVCGGCASAGSYVWVQDLPPDTTAASEYVIRVGDVVSIRVLNQDAASARSRVRSDGRIALPMVGDIDVAGRRPSALRKELEARLKDFLVAPSVTVNVDEPSALTVTVMGEVARPGIITIEPHSGLAQALALAGGLTDFADRDRIFVVRQSPKPMRVRVSWEAVTRGDPKAAAFVLAPGDVLVVE